MNFSLRLPHLIPVCDREHFFSKYLIGKTASPDFFEHDSPHNRSTSSMLIQLSQVQKLRPLIAQYQLASVSGVDTLRQKLAVDPPQ